MPFDLTYAFGEIKTSFDPAKHQIEDFSGVLTRIRDQLHRDLVENTAYGGRIRRDTTFQDMTLPCKCRYRNPLFTFMIFVDGSHFDFAKVSGFLQKTAPKYLPNLIVVLGKGVVVYATMQERFGFHKYPEFCEDGAKSWCFYPMSGIGASRIEGNHLAFLYYCLVEHLNGCFLTPIEVMQYLQPLFIGRKSQILFADNGSSASESS